MIHAMIDLPELEFVYIGEDALEMNENVIHKAKKNRMCYNNKVFLESRNGWL